MQHHEELYKRDVATHLRKYKTQGGKRLGNDPCRLKALCTLADSDLPTKGQKAMERLRPRRIIQGRATVVLRVREVILRHALPEPEHDAQGNSTDTAPDVGGVEILMWRELEKRLGGKWVSICGLVAQYLWHSDAFKAQCSCQKPEKRRCLDTTEALACENLKDLDIKEAESTTCLNSTWNDKHSITCASCSKLVYCRLLTPTVGEPLWAAGGPREVLETVLGAILGYWGMLNKGVLCRDLNDGSALVLRGGQRSNSREWREGQLPMNTTPMARTTTKLERSLREYLERLSGNPRGLLLSDLCLYPSCPQMQAELVEIRKGTPTFMSSRVLDIPVGQPYTHHFLDDLESIFWLILWLTATHLDPTSAALRIINGLDRPDLWDIYTQKRTLLADCKLFGGKSIKKQLASWGNAWASDPMVVSVIIDLGSFLIGIDHDDLDNPDYDPDIVFPCVVDIIVKALGMQPA